MDHPPYILRLCTEQQLPQSLSPFLGSYIAPYLNESRNALCNFHHFPQQIAFLAKYLPWSNIPTTASEARERSGHRYEEQVEEPEKALGFKVH